jgi:hypothetical protein
MHARGQRSGGRSARLRSFVRSGRSAVAAPPASFCAARKTKPRAAHPVRGAASSCRRLAGRPMLAGPVHGARCPIRALKFQRRAPCTIGQHQPPARRSPRSAAPRRARPAKPAIARAPHRRARALSVPPSARQKRSGPLLAILGAGGHSRGARSGPLGLRPRRENHAPAHRAPVSVARSRAPLSARPSVASVRQALTRDGRIPELMRAKNARKPPPAKSPPPQGGYTGGTRRDTFNVSS